MNYLSSQRSTWTPTEPSKRGWSQPKDERERHLPGQPRKNLPPSHATQREDPYGHGHLAYPRPCNKVFEVDTPCPLSTGRWVCQVEHATWSFVIRPLYVLRVPVWLLELPLWALARGLCQELGDSSSEEEEQEEEEIEQSKSPAKCLDQNNHYTM